MRDTIRAGRNFRSQGKNKIQNAKFFISTVAQLLRAI